jgi:DNA-directed RNA polymerase subunit beta
MIGGGEFIINGAERVIVSQLHRSPGVDFVKDQAEGDRALHACRIIPERGSWIEINVTRKDVLASASISRARSQPRPSCGR